MLMSDHHIYPCQSSQNHIWIQSSILFSSFEFVRCLSIDFPSSWMGTSHQDSHLRLKPLRPWRNHRSPKWNKHVWHGHGMGELWVPSSQGFRRFTFIVWQLRKLTLRSEIWWLPSHIASGLSWNWPAKSLPVPQNHRELDEWNKHKIIKRTILSFHTFSRNVMLGIS